MKKVFAVAFSHSFQNSQKQEILFFLLDNLILDVRTQDEWDFGHIENATLALNLGSFGNEGHVGASPSDFSGCKSCTIVIYCRK